MPSILSHPAVPLAIGLGLGSGIVPRKLLVAGVVFSIVPDLDVYGQDVVRGIGHRGITHTLLFAVACGMFAAVASRALRSSPLVAFCFVLVATASHGLLDAFTNGGAGIPLFWPLDPTRYFMLWRVIEVSPIGIGAFFSERGLEVLLSELRWVWTSAALLGISLYLPRRSRARA
jgi:inner membrane protein